MMSRQIHKLSSLKIKSLNDKGRYADGGGLYLQVAQNGSKSWLFRFNLNKKSRQMGLGSLKDLSLVEAREKAAECRKLLTEGIDPITRAKEVRKALEREQNTAMTFKECSNAYIQQKLVEWKNSKHRQQWHNTIETYALPIVGKMSVADIELNHIISILEPIWRSKTETATRIRARLERILDWAKVRGFRSGENPARWKGNLSEILPTPSKIQKVKHLPAMPYFQIHELIKPLCENHNIGARALLFAILTAARSGEVRKAVWNEIDFEQKTWTIPEERMKSGVEHVVPLSTQALELLSELHKLHTSNFIFPGTRSARPLSDMTLTKSLRSYGYTNYTVHGFRSSFRDWAGDQTNYPVNVIEYCLAHKLKDKVEAAYHRSNLLEKRRPLIQEWADFCFNA